MSPTLWVQYTGLFELIAIVIGFVLVVYLTIFCALMLAGLATYRIVQVRDAGLFSHERVSQFSHRMAVTGRSYSTGALSNDPSGV